VDKLVFLMWRKAGISREAFCEHYLEFHSLLGLRFVKGLDGYTVNIPDVAQAPVSDDGPDAIVEMWTRDVESFLDPERAFASAEDREIVLRDDASFIGSSLIWQVRRKHDRGLEPLREMRVRTEGVKRVTLCDIVPTQSLSPTVSRVATYEVVRAMSARRPAAMNYEPMAIINEWAPDVETLGPALGPSFVVSEYRQRVPPLS
jgi:hypothetical protein